MFFHKIHKDLTESSKSYAIWHEHPLHSAVHWSALFAIAILITLSLLQQISASFAAVSHTSLSAAALSRPSAQSVREPAQDHILFSFKSGVGSSIQSKILREENIKLAKSSNLLGLLVGIISLDDTPNEVVRRLMTNDSEYINAAMVDYIGVKFQN